MQLVTSKVVARYLGLTERRVRQLRDSGVISEENPGLYSLIDTVHKYIDYIKGNGEGGLDYNSERAMLVKAKRQSAEYDLKLKEGELHESKDVEMALKTMLTAFKARLSAVPAKLSPILAARSDPTEVFDLIKEEMDEALTEMSDYDSVFGGNIEKEKE